MESSSTRSPLQERLYDIIFGFDSVAGRRFDLVLIVLILSSVLVVLLDSVSSIPLHYHRYFFWLEMLFTLFFTVEYLVRIYCSPKPREYILSFYGVIDFLSIVPVYLSFFFPAAQGMLLLRILRFFRILRVLRLMRYLSEANLLMRSLKASRRKILIFMVAICALTLIYGSLMYAVEGPENGFTSIPKSVYWAIVTITTVGYGDISPATPLGQALASLVMITGFAIISVPTGIVTAELANEMRKERSSLMCNHCERGGHDRNAKFCKHCGVELEDDTLVELS
ncbi:ion transporter [Alginatibacterium sediminis]|uniref:Ion transporter n=1 Tax=Alginatibacterium sediminis TaxID=2164068 RepID=A0A420ED17_9ALTE|nr:ion transporter [Alginatibacterium sediminis]RKF18522.1 ion transporter [Alginatibacterium sediminis]